MSQFALRFVVTTAAAALLLAACSAKTGEAAAPTQAEATAVTLQAQPNLSESVEAFPRLAGDGAAIQAINADLTRRDAAAREGGCEGEQGGEGFERGVSEPMTGPGFISFWLTENYFCEGSAHPGFDQTALTYDLTTGAPVDWVAAAPGLKLVRADTTDMPATYEPTLSSPEISAFYSKRMLAIEDAGHLSDCRDVWTPESLADTGFKLWLDAENGGVSIGADFAHVSQACGDTVTMTADEMRDFGIPASMIQAVTAAHAAGNWAPKEAA